MHGDGSLRKRVVLRQSLPTMQRTMRMKTTTVSPVISTESRITNGNGYGIYPFHLRLDFSSGDAYIISWP
ncbi:hypothetical protein LINPERPRIM_LOCUS14919 [Linum perenne]